MNATVTTGEVLARQLDRLGGAQRRVLATLLAAHSNDPAGLGFCRTARSPSHVRRTVHGASVAPLGELGWVVEDRDHADHRVVRLTDRGLVAARAAAAGGGVHP